MSGGMKGLVAAVCALPILLTLGGCDKPSGAAAMPEPRPVRVATVRLEAAETTARWPATLRPRVEADLAFRVGGKVISRLVNVGDRVDAGTPLARLDTTDLELAVKAARAQLASARADADNARGEFERYSKLRSDGWSTPQVLDQRRTAAEKATAAVRQIESDLDSKTNALNYTTLLADGPGVVTSTSIEPGQVVAAGQSALRVARLGEIEAVANVPENAVRDLRDRSLTVELWAMPGREVAGSLREVSPSADAATRTFQAKITLAAPPDGALIGMTATVVARSRAGGAIARLPIAALTQSGTDPAVWVVDADRGSLELRPVRVAAFAGNEVVLSDGVRDGERVVSAGVHKLDAGQKVRVWTEPAK